MRASRAAAVAALAVLALAACGKSTGYKSGAGGTAATTQTTTGASASQVGVASNARFGQFLVDSSGRTLYHFDRDVGGTIACTSSCASVWPPLLLPAGADRPTSTASLTGLSAVTRPDGGRQVSYQGRPLYRYSRDAKAGDTNGEGVGGVWHVAAATAAPEATTTTTTTSAARAPTTTRAVTQTTVHTTQTTSPPPTSPPATSPPATSPPATSPPPPPPPPTSPPTTACVYSPCY